MYILFFSILYDNYNILFANSIDTKNLGYRNSAKRVAAIGICISG